MLGAGMVIVQDKTNKIVVIQDTKTKEWFLPRGRKDRGESLEQTAMREAYEEVNVFPTSRSKALFP
jgi:8-oxo-dGTP pyrophosphatase MutT (NUDIX family)